MNSVLLKILGTSSQWSAMALRLGLGLMILPHGLQKLLGCFGGAGFQATLQGFATLGIPSVLTIGVILIEILGGLGLLFGLGTRIAAGSVGIVLMVAAILVHRQHGFFMNWFGKQTGEGLEFFVLVLAIVVALMFQGGGKFSLDQWFSQRLR